MVYPSFSFSSSVLITGKENFTRQGQKDEFFRDQKTKRKNLIYQPPVQIRKGFRPPELCFASLVVLVPSHSMGGLLPFSFASLSTPSRDHASDYTRYIHRPGRTRKQVLRSIRAHLLTLSPSPSPSHPTPSCTPYLMNEITGR